LKQLQVLIIFQINEMMKADNDGVKSVKTERAVVMFGKIPLWKCACFFLWYILCFNSFVESLYLESME